MLFSISFFAKHAVLDKLLTHPSATSPLVTSTMSKPKTEILVHIAAPSRAVDDTNYRSLAAAYLAFQPTTRTRIPLQDELVPTDDVADTDQSNPPATQNTSLEGFSWPSQRSIPLESPDLSFRGVVDNLSSPYLRHPGNEENKADEALRSSWEPPPSVIADSNPENNLAIPRYCSPTRILEHYLQGHEVSQSEPSQALLGQTVGPTSSLVEQAPFMFSGVDYSFTDLGAVQYDTSELPSSVIIPQSPLTPGHKQRRLPIPNSSGTQAIASSFGPAEERSSPQPSTRSFAQLQRADSAPPPRKRQKRSPDGEEAKSLARSSSDIGPRQEREKVQRLDGLQRARQSPDGLQICSPPPPVSCETLEPSAFVTETLAKLARDLDIGRRYQPKEKHRDIRPFERGYWLVDCTSWAGQLKDTAWGFLSNYIGNGVAGWGIRCCRDEEFTWIRLYCWGSVIGHMHLVLYLASQRRILYTGSTWIGGDGKTVIVMGSKPTKSSRETRLA